MVVNDPQKLVDSQKQHYTINTELYGGLNIRASNKKKGDLDTAYQKKLKQFNTTFLDNAGVYGYTRIQGVQEIMSMLGGVFFIGIFLSIVFMLGTVLVIYYKQISEGYEDRDRFVILQKVGLDEKADQAHHSQTNFDCVLLTACFRFCASGICLSYAESHVESFRCVECIINANCYA